MNDFIADDEEPIAHLEMVLVTALQSAMDRAKGEGDLHREIRFAAALHALLKN